MNEKEKKLREDLEFHLDTLRRNLEAVSLEDLKTKYTKPFKELKDNICKTATAYTQHISLSGICLLYTSQNRAMRPISRPTSSPLIRASGMKTAGAKSWKR